MCPTDGCEVGARRAGVWQGSPVDATAPLPDEPWWKTAVFYQIYPRSFADGNGDGIGDLPGIVEHLDHLVELGVDAVWLSPFYESPMRDFGYDISDHCAVDPVFGSLEDFDRVLEGLHDRGIKLIVDFVPNHVSSDHPWFVEARSDPSSDKRDWFVWADPVDGPDGERLPPTNWTASFTEESAWEWDEASGQYYLHLFLPEQPDVNWQHPDLERAMHDVLRFWLDRGVDGFRMDVLNAIGKDPEPRDVPDSIVGIPQVVLVHHDTAMPLIRRIRGTVDDAGDTFIIGEIVTGDIGGQASYQGTGDRGRAPRPRRGMGCPAPSTAAPPTHEREIPGRRSGCGDGGCRGSRARRTATSDHRTGNRPPSWRSGRTRRRVPTASTPTRS